MLISSFAVFGLLDGFGCFDVWCLIVFVCDFGFCFVVLCLCVLLCGGFSCLTCFMV